MFCKIFLSPQVKRRLIITHKRCIYELFDELPNDLRLFPNHSSPWHSRHPGGLSHTRKKRLKEIRKHQESAQTPQNDSPAPTRKPRQHWQKTPQKQKLHPPRGAPPHTKTRVSLKYPASHCRPDHHPPLTTA